MPNVPSSVANSLPSMGIRVQMPSMVVFLTQLWPYLLSIYLSQLGEGVSLCVFTTVWVIWGSRLTLQWLSCPHYHEGIEGDCGWEWGPREGTVWLPQSDKEGLFYSDSKGAMPPNVYISNVQNAQNVEYISASQKWRTLAICNDVQGTRRY